jgi:hypothetical protein
MAQSGWRLPDDLLRRVRVRCAEEGVRQNEFVERALESALKVPPLESLGPSPSPALVAEASRASAKGAVSRAMRAEVEGGNAQIDAEEERADIQALALERHRERKAPKKKPAAGGLPSIAPRHWGA